MKTKLMLIGACCAISLSAMAQTAKPDTTLTIGEVTVQGSRVGRNVVSASPVMTLGRNELLRIGASEVGEALKHIGGVQVRDYGGVGGLKTVDVRGMGAMHTGVVYDGVEVGDMQSGQVDLGRFATGGLSGVELGIGQADDIFQSAKTLTSAAVISISSLLDVSRDSLSVGLHTGSWGLAGGSLLGLMRRGQLRLGAFADYERSDGSYPFHLHNGTQTISRNRSNSDVSLWRGELNMGYDFSSNHHLRIKAYGYTSDRGLPGAVIYDNPEAHERLAERNTFVQATYRGDLSRLFSLRGAMKWNYSYSRDRNVVATRPTEDKYIQQEGYFSATLLAHVVKGLYLSASQDYQVNHLAMSLPSCPFPTRQSLWSAAGVHYSSARFSATATLLYTHIHESVRTGQPSPGFSRATPAFSASYVLLPGLRIRAGYKDIFRTPTLNDLYYTGAGRRNLKPEKNRQWNLGITFAPQLRGIVRSLSLTADAYYGHVSDKIVAVPHMFTWSMTNRGKVRQTGLDLTARSEIAIARGWAVRAMANYSLMVAKDRTNPDEMVYDDKIAYTPRHSGNALLTLATPWLDITYSMLTVSRRYMEGYNSPENRIPGYADHSLSLSRCFNLGRHSLLLRLDINNIGGRNYEIVRFYPMSGCNWKASVVLKY